MGFKCPECGTLHDDSVTLCPATGKKLEFRDRYVGRVLKGKYRVKRFMAEGGMGTVFEAEHSDLERTFAIKTLHPKYAMDTDTAERFKREAKAAARVRHEHIVWVSDIDEDEDGIPFMVMEYLEGESLFERINRRGSLPVTEAVDIALQILSALVSTHANGVIHRDLKPENVFLTLYAGNKSWVKLLDFGLAKFKESPDAKSLTKDGMIIGTPGFMAPEQIDKTSPIDARTDIYACGMLLYNALTETLPFDTGGVHAMIYQVLDKTPEHPSDLEPFVPRQLGDVVMRAIAKNPDMRYESAREMLHALKPFGSGDFVFEEPAGSKVGETRKPAGAAPAGVQTTPPPVLTTGYTTTLRSFSGRRRAVITAVAVAVVLVAAALVSYFQVIRPFTRSGAATQTARVDDVELAQPPPEKEPPPAPPNETPEAIPSDRGSLKISTEPDEARILLDGAELEGNPHESLVKADGSMHKLEVSLEGYATHTQWVKFEGDVEKHVALEKEKTPPTAKKHKPKEDKPFKYVDKNPYGKK